MSSTGNNSPPEPTQLARRLLIVEDEMIAALELRQTLGALGYQVVGRVSTADEALQAAQEHHPDLVLMDIRLADERTMERALQVAPAAYVSKPFTARTLLATIELACLQHTQALHERAAHAAECRRLEQQNFALARIADHLRVQATLDPLTGLYNRRQLDVVIEREVKRARREKLPLGIVLLDLDRFKQLNDTFGHLAGDDVLRAVAGLLQHSLRASDTACRFGGEELVLVLPGADANGAAQLAERLRVGIESLVLEHAGNALPPITASFGVAAYPTPCADPGWLLETADRALYASKIEGRNRVTLAPASDHVRTSTTRACS